MRSNKSLIIFFLIAFAMAWLLMGIAVAVNYGLLNLEIPLEPFLIIGSWVPNIAAFIVIRFILKRKNGIKNLIRGWLIFRFKPYWYLAAASPLIVAFLVLLVYKLFSGYYPVSELAADPAAILSVIIMITITGAMGEELGWRGFVQPWLLTQMSALNAGLLLGVVWVLWHLPLWFAGLGFEDIPYWAYAITGISFTITATWAVNNTGGSMFIASLLHLTLNLSVNIIDNHILPYYAFGMILFAVILILIFKPERLSRKTQLPINTVSRSWEYAAGNS
jgi:uncharacterized protein